MFQKQGFYQSYGTKNPPWTNKYEQIQSKCGLFGNNLKGPQPWQSLQKLGLC